MNLDKRQRFQLATAIIILLSTIYLSWQVDSARIAQHRYLGGCWPEYVKLSVNNVFTVDFWLNNVETLSLGPVEKFFHSRVRHRILFYMLIIGSLIGWAGSVFLRIVTSEEDAPKGSPREPPSWEVLISSFFLAPISGAILFLLMVSGRLAFDPQGDACINEGYGYFALVCAILGGLFVTLFFEWLRDSASRVWNRIANKSSSDD